MMKTFKDALEPFLKKIGWSLEDYGCEHFIIFDHEGKNTNWTCWKNQLEHKDGHASVCNSVTVWYLDGVTIELLKDSTSISIRPKKVKNVFILFMNHEIKKRPKGSGVKNDD